MEKNKEINEWIVCRSSRGNVTFAKTGNEQETPKLNQEINEAILIASGRTPKRLLENQ